MCPTAANMFARSIILSAIASIALLSGSATALATPDVEARATAGVSVEAACNIAYGTSFTAVATGSGCNDWKCQRGSESYGIDLNEWCRDTYGGSSTASCSGGVYNWVCNY
jgi:hypothetical protein